MEEEVSLKVTRLRRRLSVESEDTKSPSTPSTPTKKRGGRLAAKPQLELIEENATETVAKRTRKSTIKDLVEPADEKPVTPSRRSTRTRSNTSILSESQSGDTVDEKPMTPARRSARIRSNTSLVSETTQSYDSPRAKRAARRTSQVGSDTEAPTTPARQARKTRKDSTSSVDKAEINTAKVGSPIKEVIAEEVETHVKETNNNNTLNSDPNPLRKSPRLIEKGPRKSAPLDNDNKENQPQSDKDSCGIDNDTNKESVKQVEPIENSAVNVDSKIDEMEPKSSDFKNLSITSTQLIEQMDTENKRSMSKMNKTTSIVDESKDFKSKRHRTKSWTTISMPAPNDGCFYSDSELSKKKTKKASNNSHVGNNSGSEDRILNVNSQTNMEVDDEQKNNIISLNTSSKKKKRLSEKCATNDEPDLSYNIATSDKSINLEKIVSEINNDTKEHDNSTDKNILSGAEKLFEEVPSGVVQSLVYIEDSDSNTENTNTDKLFNGGDQCVPVIEHQPEEDTFKPQHNVSCEPMDIDETIPENASIILLPEKDISLKSEDQGKEGKRKSSIYVPNEDSINNISNKSKRKSSVGNSESQILDKTDNANKSTRKSSICVPNEDSINNISNKSKRKSSVGNTESQILDKTDNANKSTRKSSICVPNEDSINNISSKSKRKSSVGNSESQILDKTDNANKSTLVISQIKDISTNGQTPVTNSAKTIVDTNEPLSKSFNVNESYKNKNVDKRNISLTYSTSTPLQQKSLQKLGMQINTSIITPNNKNKKEEVGTKSTNGTAMLSQNVDSDSEDESDSEESETSEGRSKLIIDEAEEASDDYESGDSREEEERQYEEDHEIKERGETLDSDDEEEYSDDSDYEKGSFIVSSDEEDNKLLSGSDDDLDMSADELTMSAKSKKKYNERKVKEQKRASREMFQARHKVDESDKSIKPNKLQSKKANRLESSDSEDDANVEKKKNRRQRIDSSQDISVDVEKSLLKKKTKARRLSDSMSEDNATSEKEMTICEENNIDKYDPLVQNIIKEEPKTPLKEFDISTIQVMDLEQVEEIHVDENVSMMKINETTDPLQATTLPKDQEDEEDSDINSISENEEITQNYDSLLNNLNNSKSKQIKTLDMSLNINKKKKQKTKEPVIDQLNLTQTKKSRKNKNSTSVYCPESKKINEPMNKSRNNSDSQNEDSSDSIDMKLLFPEDSNDSEVVSAKKQNDDTTELTDKDTIGIAKDFIPLKRTDAKTNILEDLSQPDKSERSASKKKNNKKPKLSQAEYSPSKDDQDDNDVSFFMDTTGTHIEGVESNILNKSSAKKNKNKRNSTSVANVDDIIHTVTVADKIELNVSIENSSKKNKDKKKGASTKNTSEINDDSVTNEGNNKNRNNSIVANIDAIKVDFNDEFEIDLEVSMKNSAKKNKGKKKDASIIDSEETKSIDIAAEETSIVHSAKKNKKKNKKADNSEQVESEELDTSTKGNAKKIKHNESLIAAEVDVSIKSSGKKNKKSSEEIRSDIHIDEEEANVSKIKDDVVNDEPVVKNAKKKKNKNSLDTSVSNIETQEVGEIDGAMKDFIDVSLVTEGNHKKKKKRMSESRIAEQTEEPHVIIDDDDKSQKRKRKLSTNQNVEGVTIKDIDAKDSNTSKSLNESITTSSQKKKRKVSHNNEEIAIQNEDPISEIHEEINVKKSKKKNKHKQNVDTDQAKEDVLPSTKKDVNLVSAEDQLSETKKVNKKRKLRDDDDEAKTSKIIKQNSFDKVHIPRLPDDVLIQLDDKPKQLESKKKKIISTTPFLVEETIKRKNKPSNYLEQSVYLNDTLEDKKQKGSMKTPRVLPFIPTASTSDSGFTTNFRIKVIEEQPVFAQSSDAVNFKNQYLHNKKIKKLGTYEKYKKQRNIKLSKF